MADEFSPIGKALVIPDNVINKIDDIDKKINQIADDSENMARRFSSAMALMGSDAGELLKKLQSIQDIMGKIGASKSGGLDNMASGMNKTATEAEKVVDNLTGAAVALNRFGQGEMNIAQLTAKIKELNKELTTGEGVTPMSAQQSTVNTVRELEEELKRQKKSENQIDEENIKQAERKQKNLDRLVESYEKLNSVKAKSQEQDDSKTADWVLSKKKEQIRAEQEAAQIAENYQRQEQARVEAIAKAEDEKRKAKRASYEEALKYAEELDRKEAAAAKERLAEEKRLEQERKRAYNEQAKQYQQQNLKANTTVSGALSFAESANTISRRTRAIQYLTQARAQLSTTDAQYTTKLQKLNDAIARMNKLNSDAVKGAETLRKSHSNLMNTSGQLARQFALLFSVSQITGYVNKLVKVRGEFELQNAALASILQNKEQADKLFSQITTLAVQSPFTVKELTTYTKSLSAYSVEYEKLYDTTKMLADVAAGLGVDMQRLILAFGQVKAANFLRGTETRQFTEAGINMLGELSKYYSELEGRVVSVTEVMDRQFKRMISFQDVEAVFQRLTSEGGMFYNMQEKQAETLAGMRSNLQDSIDLMLNDIGQANEGAIKGILNFIKSIVENWKTIAQIAEPIASMLVLYFSITKGSQGLSKIWESLSRNIGIVVATMTRAEAAQRKFNLATQANAWLAVGTVVATVVWEVVNAIKAAREEQEKLNEIASEGYFNSVTSQAEYKKLASVVSDTTASYQEQQDALDKLKRIYGEILPKHYLEAEAIRAMKGNYDEATAAIQNYIRAKTQEKQLRYISEEYEEEVQSTQKKLASHIQEQVEDLYDYKLSMSEINVILAEFRKEFDEGMIKSPEEARKKINALLSSFLNKDIKINLGEVVGTLAPRLEDYAVNYFNSLVVLKSKTDDIINSSSLQWGDRITLDLQKRREELDNQIKEAKGLLGVISKQGQIGTSGSIITQQQVDDAKSKLSEIVKQWGIDSSYISKLTGDAFEIKQATIDINQAALKSFANTLSNTKFEPNQMASVLKFIEGINKEIESFYDSDFQGFIKDIVVSASEMNKISLGSMVDAFANAEESISDYTKRIEAKVTQLRENIALFNKSPYLVAEWAGDPKKAEEAQKMLNVYQTILDNIKINEKGLGGGGGENTALERLKEQIELLKKAQEEYKKLREYESEEGALAQTRGLFEGTSVENIVATMTFDASGMIDGFKKLVNNAGKEGDKLLKETLRPFERELIIKPKIEGLEDIKKQIDEMLEGYNWYKDIEKLGLDKNVISKIFGIDTFSLEEVKQKLNKAFIDLANQREINAAESEGRIPKLYSDAEKSAESLGTKEYEIYKNFLNKIGEQEKEELKNRLKTYAGYLAEAVDERIKIEQGYQKEVANIRKTQGLDDKEKEFLVTRAGKIRDKNLASYDFRKFQESDLYVSAFEDLQRVGDYTLQTLLKRLEELKNGAARNLPLEEFKEFMEIYKKIREEIEDRSPWVSMIDGFKEWRGAVEEVRMSEERLDAVRSGAKIATGGYINSEGKFTLTYLTEEEAINKVAEANNKLTAAKEKTVTAAKNIQSSYQSAASGVNELLSSFTELAEAFGAELSPETEAAIEGIGKGFEVVATVVGVLTTVLIAAAAAGTSLMTVLAPLLAIGAALGVVIAAIKIGDAKRQRVIDAEQDKIEDLQRAYTKLQDTIDKGLSIDSYSKTNQLVGNLYKQIESYQKMIAAEQDKKSSNDDQIREWQNAIEDSYTEIENLFYDMKVNLVGDFKDVAQQLADALVQAFQEGTSAAEAWGDAVNDIIVNILKTQLIQKVLEPRIQEVLDGMYADAKPKTSYAEKKKKEAEASLAQAYNMGLSTSDINLIERIYSGNYTHEDIVNVGNISGQQAQAVIDYIKKYQEYIAALAEAGGEAYNFTEDIIEKGEAALQDVKDYASTTPEYQLLESFINKNATDNMSGLQAGIEGITEETAQALEALLNSMRYYVADSNTQIKGIYTLLLNPPTENPFIKELRSQTILLSSIDTMLNAVIKTSSGKGKIMRVEIV